MKSIFYHAQRSAFLLGFVTLLVTAAAQRVVLEEDIEAFAADDGTVVVGFEDAEPVPEFYRSGSAMVLQETSGSWRVVQELLPEDLTSSMEFGAEVAIQGKTIMVAAPEVNAVYVFNQTAPQVWEQTQILKPNNGQSGETFGSRLIVNGEYAFIYEYEPESIYYVYHLQSNGQWQQTQVLGYQDEESRDGFAESPGYFAATEHNIWVIEPLRNLLTRLLHFELRDGQWQLVGPMNLTVGDIELSPLSVMSIPESDAAILWARPGMVGSETYELRSVNGQTRLSPLNFADATKTEFERGLFIDESTYVEVEAYEPFEPGQLSYLSKRGNTWHYGSPKPFYSNPAANFGDQFVADRSQRNLFVTANDVLFEVLEPIP